MRTKQFTAQASLNGEVVVTSTVAGRKAERDNQREVLARASALGCRFMRVQAVGATTWAYYHIQGEEADLIWRTDPLHPEAVASFPS